MRAVVIEGAFGVENLRVVERPDPTPAPREVVVRLRAASLNYRDLLVVLGQYNPRQPLPLVPLSDGVGDVVAIGDGVKRFSIGDRVSPIFATAWLAGAPTAAVLRTTLGSPNDGVLREQISLHEDALVRVPEHLTDAEAATLPCAGVTAWCALFTEGRVEPGQTVLVQGTGGVSLFALSLAKLAGAEVIVTSSSDEKLERAKALGADFTINYRSTPEWGKAARARSPGGVDHVVDVGGATTLEQSLRAVRVGGTVSVIGVLGGAAAPINVLPILMQQVRLQGVIVGPRDAFESMNRAIAKHALRPVVDRTFAMEELGEALRHMQRGAHFGKLVLSIAERGG